MAVIPQSTLNTIQTPKKIQEAFDSPTAWVTSEPTKNTGSVMPIPTIIEAI